VTHITNKIQLTVKYITISQSCNAWTVVRKNYATISRSDPEYSRSSDYPVSVMNGSLTVRPQFTMLLRRHRRSTHMRPNSSQPKHNNKKLSYHTDSAILAMAILGHSRSFVVVPIDAEYMTSSTP